MRFWLPHPHPLTIIIFRNISQKKNRFLSGIAPFGSVTNMVYYKTRNMVDSRYACPRNLRGKPSLKILLLLLRQSSSPWLSSSCSSPSSWSAWCSSSPSGRWVLSFSFWAHLVLSSSCIMNLVCIRLNQTSRSKAWVSSWWSWSMGSCHLNIFQWVFCFPVTCSNIKL